MAFFKRKPKHAAPAAAPTATATATAVLDTPVVDTITGDYTIDPSHSRIGFIARHAMVTSVQGSFKDFEGTAHLDDANPAASSVSLTIKTDSVDTGSADRDGHLASADFFDVATHPDITFVSTAVSRDDDEWTVVGDLTIKGTSVPVTVEFEYLGTAQDPFGNVRVGFEGATTVNRKDWGLVWNAALETGGMLVSEKIKLQFDVSAIKNA